MAPRPRTVAELGFAPQPPVGVACIELSPDKGRVAVARTNGALETWTVYRRRPYIARQGSSTALRGVTVRGLRWLDAETVCSATLGGQLLVWNVGGAGFPEPTLESTVQSGGGAVWCMAGHPDRSRVLAVGCDDGRVRYFSNAKAEDSSTQGDVLGMLARLTSTAEPGSPHVTACEFSPDGKRCYVATTSGCLTASDWETRGERWSRDMTTQQGRGRDTKRAETGFALVWKILPLRDSVLCGTATGEVKILDPHTGVLLQSIHSHKADVLSLMPGGGSEADTCAFCSGVDNELVKVVQRHGDMQWMAAQKRIWCSGDITCGVRLTDNLLLTGCSEGTLAIAEEDKLFASTKGSQQQEVGTALGSVEHHWSPPLAPTTLCNLSDELLLAASGGRSDVLVQRTDFHITFYALPSPELPEVVTLLRYGVAGMHGVLSYAVAEDCSVFAFSTVARTAVCRVVARGPDEVHKLSALPVSVCDGLPRATSMSFVPSDDYGAAACLALAHDDGVTLADASGAKMDLPDAPKKVQWRTVSAVCKNELIAAGGCGSSAPGIVVCWGSGVPHAAQKAKRRRVSKMGDNNGRALLFVSHTPVPVSSVAFVTAGDSPALAMVQANGSLSVLSLDGSVVWDQSTHLGKFWSKLPPAVRCSGVESSSEVLVYSSAWFALVDVNAKYSSVKQRKFGTQLNMSPDADDSELPVVRVALDSAHMRSPNDIALVTAGRDLVLEFAPPAFSRKRYAT
eukprot:TRINITY_DN32087_c0_g1_i1.p1 TRINITY_DN32087_c0_g1~~TRINITY_DN32087_c0_g1_i1.p1  ORF type:complete len:760 (+),score=233.81 TRINITY_DN32087_c0_g1_i1:67-2280(+)